MKKSKECRKLNRIARSRAGGDKSRKAVPHRREKVNENVRGTNPPKKANVRR